MNLSDVCDSVSEFGRREDNSSDAKPMEAGAEAVFDELGRLLGMLKGA
jgi:hypothetical protein